MMLKARQNGRCRVIRSDANLAFSEETRGKSLSKRSAYRLYQISLHLLIFEQMEILDHICQAISELLSVGSRGFQEL